MHMDVFFIQLVCCRVDPCACMCSLCSLCAAEWIRARICVHCAAGVLQSGPVRVYVFIVQLMCCRVDPCACVCSLCSWCAAEWTRARVCVHCAAGVL
jgi:hypothetical protein